VGGNVKLHFLKIIIEKKEKNVVQLSLSPQKKNIGRKTTQKKTEKIVEIREENLHTKRGPSRNH